MKNTNLFTKLLTSLVRLFRYDEDSKEYPATSPGSWSLGWLSVFAVITLTAAHMQFAYTGLGFVAVLFQFLSVLYFGYLGAEFGSGVIHWALDNYGSGEGRLGDLFHREFLYHHTDPMQTTGYPTPVTMTGPALAAVLAILAGFSVDLIFDGSVISWAARVFSASFSLGIFSTRIHVWCHLRNNGEPVPELVRWLQDRNIIISPANHNVHHSDRYDKAYCLYSRQLNPLLDGIRFWAGLEWLLALFGVEKAIREVPKK